MFDQWQNFLNSYILPIVLKVYPGYENDVSHLLPKTGCIVGIGRG